MLDCVVPIDQDHPNNIFSTKARLQLIEWLKHANMYDLQIKNMIERQVAKKLKDMEIEIYE